MIMKLANTERPTGISTIQAQNSNVVGRLSSQSQVMHVYNAIQVHNIHDNSCYISMCDSSLVYVHACTHCYIAMVVTCFNAPLVVSCYVYTYNII